MLKTKDLCFAASMCSVGFNPEEVIVETLKGKPTATFYFAESTELEIAQKMFWDRALKVEPREFFTNLKDLKGRIYDTKINETV